MNNVHCTKRRLDLQKMEDEEVSQAQMREFHRQQEKGLIDNNPIWKRITTSLMRR